MCSVPEYEDELLGALRVISKAQVDTLREFSSYTCFQDALKKLNTTNSPRDNVSRLLSSCLSALPKIEKWVSRQPTMAIGEPSWDHEDCRLSDLRIAGQGKPTDIMIFRAHITNRSLTIEFEAWSKAYGHESRVHQIIKDPSANNKNGNASKFIREKGYPDSVKNSIAFGIKILVIEHCNGSAGISALLAFSHTATRTLKYDEIRRFLDKLSRNGEVNNEDEEGSNRLRCIVRQYPQFIEDCQDKYDSQCRYRTDGNGRNAESVNSGQAELQHVIRPELPRNPNDGFSPDEPEIDRTQQISRAFGQNSTLQNELAHQKHNYGSGQSLDVLSRVASEVFQPSQDKDQMLSYSNDNNNSAQLQNLAENVQSVAAFSQQQLAGLQPLRNPYQDYEAVETSQPFRGRFGSCFEGVINPPFSNTEAQSTQILSAPSTFQDAYLQNGGARPFQNPYLDPFDEFG